MLPYRSTLLIPVVSLWAVLPGCGGVEEAGATRCDRLEVRLGLENEGWYALDGTADGRAFGCSFYFEHDGFGDALENVYFGGTCSGPARFVGDRLLELEGTPATIAWTVRWGGGAPAGTTATARSGQLAPEYRAFGPCPTAELALPRW